MSNKTKLWRTYSYRDMSGRIAKSKGVARVQLAPDTPSPLILALINRLGA